MSTKQKLKIHIIPHVFDISAKNSKSILKHENEYP
jgi:hypothetical protein